MGQLWEKQLTLHNAGGSCLISWSPYEQSFPRKKGFCFQTATWKSRNSAWVSNLWTQDSSINSDLGPQPNGLTYGFWTWNPLESLPPFALASLESPNAEFFEYLLFCVLYVWLLFLSIRSLRFIHLVEGLSGSCFHSTDSSPVSGHRDSVQSSEIVTEAAANICGEILMWIYAFISLGQALYCLVIPLLGI